MLTVINVSGGRTSGYMLWRHLQRREPGSNVKTVALFANTGREREETLYFVKQMGQAWNVDIVWLEYRYRPLAKGGKGDPKEDAVVVTYETASRMNNPVPFDQLIERSRRLPGPGHRICTSNLKVRVMDWYCRRVLGANDIEHHVGIRYDEKARWARLRDNSRGLRFPLFEARITEADVRRFWATRSFDLGIPSYLSNCDLCPMKGKAQKVAAIRADPGMALWWHAKEKKQWAKKGQWSQWHPAYPVSELLDEARLAPRQTEMIASFKAPDCFCGD